MLVFYSMEEYPLTDPTEELFNQLRDPSKVGFPPLLPVELALRVDTPAAICGIYGISKEEFAVMVQHPVFVKAYQDAVEMLKVEGMSFKLKARMQAEDFLKTSYQLVQNPRTSDAVRAGLIRDTVRWAGYDAKAAEVGASGTGFAIQINFGTHGPN